MAKYIPPRKASLLKPEKVNILGVEYQIEYVDNPAEVDRNKRESLWGQIDYWGRTIRVYVCDRPEEDVFKTILHEILHGIETALKLKCFDGDRGHEEMDILAIALTDTLFRNGFIEREK